MKTAFYYSILLPFTFFTHQIDARTLKITIKNNTNKTVNCHDNVNLTVGTGTSGGPPFTISARSNRAFVIYSDNFEYGDAIKGYLTHCSVQTNEGPVFGGDKSYGFSIVYDKYGAQKELSSNRDPLIYLGETMFNKYHASYFAFGHDEDFQTFEAQIMFSQTSKRSMEAAINALNLLSN